MTGMPDSERNTPVGSGWGATLPQEMEQAMYTRQNSRGSLGTPARRGSLQIEHCQSKRGSICAYSGGAMCESTPVGEHCETRIAMMKSDTETVTNGHGSQQVVTGKLSLVNVPGFPRVTAGEQDAPRPDSAPPARTSLSPPGPAHSTEYKFPIET
jgi:hypothetical protein